MASTWVMTLLGACRGAGGPLKKLVLFSWKQRQFCSSCISFSHGPCLRLRGMRSVTFSGLGFRFSFRA